MIIILRLLYKLTGESASKNSLGTIFLSIFVNNVQFVMVYKKIIDKMNAVG